MANADDLRVEPITDPKDFHQAFYCAAEAFGHQTKDAIWRGTNPGWDTAEGLKEGAARFEKRWNGVTKNREGRPNTVFLKATLPVTKDGNSERQVVGFAIWQQASFVDGYGDPPTLEWTPDGMAIDPTEQRLATQLYRSLWKPRVDCVKEKSFANPPAVFVLDLCAVDPAFQRRGIAAKLVQWGLDEAKERHGGLEATTEASAMGRFVYAKLGFKPQGEGDIKFEVDEEFKSRDLPPNVFMRTGVPS